MSNVTGGYVYDTNTSNTIRIKDDGWDIGTTPYQKVSFGKPTKPEPYNIETFNLQKGDVILLHLSEDVDLDTANYLWKDIKEMFPDNNVIVANEYILKGLSILRLPQPETGKVNMFDEEISDPNFLDKWLKQSLEF